MLARERANHVFRTSPALNFVEEVNHRVINEYSEAIASLSLAASRATLPDAREAICGAADRLREHAALHDALKPPRGGELNNVATYVGSICEIFSTALLAPRGILLALNSVDQFLPSDDCWKIGLVVAELIRNACRHGLRNQQGHILVQITPAAGELLCLVRDNGRPPRDPSSGRGQRVISEIVADLGGRVDWTFNSDGCVVLARFPDRTAASAHTAVEGAL